MAVSETAPGRIITFYSYKGGTGRSMALANIACLLAKRLARTSQRVLVMDWDLEAPGLHRFFSAKSDLPEYVKHPGVINYFSSLRAVVTASPELCDQLTTPDGWRILGQRLPLDDYLIPDVISGVDFLRAGRFDSGYPKLVGSFNWIELFERYGAAIRAFRELLVNTFAFTLVDSRTGLTDVSGICTTLLPETLVGVFTPNLQSLEGLCDLVAQAIEYRRKSDDLRPLSVFPLPSRAENAEKDLREQWRKDYQEKFERLFRNLHETEQCDLTDYFDEVLLPHVSYYAYGELIAVLQERSDAISLSAAYQRFFERLMSSDFAWEIPEPQKAVSAYAPAQATAMGLRADKYDAFLSYASADVKAVEQVDSQLRARGVKTFFGHRDVAPGEIWSAGFSAAIDESRAIVAFVGPGGSSPWQSQESLDALASHARDPSKRVIPVLLPKAPSSEQLKLPTFLRNVQWVDLRSGLRDKTAMGNLVWALTGQRPVSKPLHLARGVIGAVALFVLITAGWLELGRNVLRRREGPAASMPRTSSPKMPEKLPLESANTLRIEYFPHYVSGVRPDAVMAALHQLGASVTQEPRISSAVQDLPTNCIWVGDAVTQEEARAVALAITAAGVKLRDIRQLQQGSGSHSRLIEIGSSSRVEHWPVLSAADIMSRGITKRADSSF